MFADCARSSPRIAGITTQDADMKERTIVFTAAASRRDSALVSTRADAKSSECTAWPNGKISAVARMKTGMLGTRKTAP